MPADDPREPSARGGPRVPAEGGRTDRGRGRRRSRLSRALSGPPVRGRRVRRTVRHIEPWSVLRIALLFHAAVFLVVCVASALLWAGARASGTLGNVESFVTSIGGFGDCEPIEGFEPTVRSTTTIPDGDDEASRQLDPNRGRGEERAEEEVPLEEEEVLIPDDDEDCGEGRELVGEFKFEDVRIFQAFAFGGVVLVLAGTGAAVVLVLLFNLMSDLTGGVQVTVIEEEPKRRRSADAGSPPPRRDG